MKSTLSKFILTGVSGILYCLAFVGFDQWYLAWVCLIPLLFALEGTSPKQGFLLGWLFGTVALIGGFYWLTYTIHVFAFMPWIVAGIGCALLCAAQATQFAIFGLIYSIARRNGFFGPVIAGTVIFVAAEFVCPQLFPHYFGASQYLQLPLIQISDITGVMGVTALIILVNTSIYALLKDALINHSFNWKPLAASTVMIVCALSYGYMKIGVIDDEMKTASKLRIGIAQANMGIREKHAFPEKAIGINQEMTRTLKNEGAELVVWPETAATKPILSPSMTQMPEAIFDDLDVPIITGAIEYAPDGDNYNMHNHAVLAGKDGSILGRYRKQVLLMLGEYIPLGERFPVLYEWMPFVSHFTPGTSNEPLKLGERLLNLNICYEEILPRFMRQMMEDNPDVIINITNDNWFGKTSEPMQHLALALFRAVEHRKWLVRSTNTGVSAFVDANGRIVEKSPLMEPATMIADVPMMRMETLYTKYGDWFGWICAIGATGMFTLGILRKTSKG